MAVIVEDEVDIRHLLETVLTQAGFQVIATGNGVDGIEAVRRYDPIVTTLDVNMPGMDGFEVARRIRAFSSTYIVMLTALHDEIDTLQGLEAGADDYITKPFRPREVRARIEAMLRRPRASAMPGDAGTDTSAPSASLSEHSAPISSAMSSDASARHRGAANTDTSAAMPNLAMPDAAITNAMIVETVEVPSHAEPSASQHTSEVPKPAPVTVDYLVPTGAGWLEHNGLWLNIETRVVTCEGVEIDLTRSEFDLLATLLESGRRVRTKPDLVLLLRGESYVTTHFVNDADKRAIEVHLGNLRKKLGDNVQAPRWIETVRGIGYRLSAPDGA